MRCCVRYIDAVLRCWCSAFFFFEISKERRLFFRFERPVCSSHIDCKKKKKKSIMISSDNAVSFFVTIFWFFLEALMHYNIGRHGSIWITTFPELEEMILILISIAICSFLSTVTTNAITRILKVTLYFFYLERKITFLLAYDYTLYSEKQR